MALQLYEGATPEYVQVLKEAGLAVYAWDYATLNDGAEISRLGVDGYIPQIEGPNQDDAVLANFAAGVGKGLYRSVVTTYSGENVPELQKYIYTALVECYAPENPPAQYIERMIWQGQQYGWKKLVPVYGLYHDYPLTNYSRLTRECGIWLAETCSDADIAVIGGL